MKIRCVLTLENIALKLKSPPTHETTCDNVEAEHLRRHSHEIKQSCYTIISDRYNGQSKREIKPEMTIRDRLTWKQQTKTNSIIWL